MTCRDCHLVFAHPLPDLSFERLQDVYDADYTVSQREADAEAATSRLLRDATHRQMEIVERHVRKGSALNVGAMSSASAVLLERGWTLRVVEVSRYAAETARARWGFDVTISRIEDFEAPEGSFDFVKLGHVIEHLADPALVLRRVAAMLRRGGVLLIDTDNARGLRTQAELAARGILGETLATTLVRRLTGKNLRTRYGRLIPPVHLYCFSEKSMSRLLESAGLVVAEVYKPAWGDPTWFPLGDRSEMRMVERAFLALDQVGARFGRGEVLAMLARKP